MVEWLAGEKKERVWKEKAGVYVESVWLEELRIATRTLGIPGLPFEIRTLNLPNRKQKCFPLFFSDRGIQWKNISMPSIEERIRD
jgi:hypothetical protein